MKGKQKEHTGCFSFVERENTSTLPYCETDQAVRVLFFLGGNASFCDTVPKRFCFDSGNPVMIGCHHRKGFFHHPYEYWPKLCAKGCEADVVRSTKPHFRRRSA